MSTDRAPGRPRAGSAPEAAERPARGSAVVTGTWIGVGALVFSLALLVGWLSWSLPLGRALEPLKSPTLVLVTADGQPFARRGAYKEAPVDVNRLPAYVPLAFVAIEDRRFFEHHGLDVRALTRALIRDLMARHVQEGGSTLTQQLAKNAFLNGDRTLRRKGQEAVIALYLETRLSKAEILSRYLSGVYFGDGVFGIRAAARHYFDKTPETLSIGEAAMLAGLVKAPSRLEPTENLPAALKRTRVVLGAMVRMGVITRAQAEAAADVQLHPGRSTLPVGSWFADWISPDAKRAFQWGYGEVVVRTTLDSRLQTAAEQIIARTLNGPGARMGASQAALVAMRTDGSVVAMVGGRNYQASSFNRAVSARRQPGSAFKLFVYLAAMRQGFTPDTLVDDSPVQVGGWTPQNYEGEYAGGPIPLREAFARSSNVAAVRVAETVGLDKVQRAARDLGITAPLPNDATLALGTADLSLLELTSAYAALDAGGAPVAPRGLERDPQADRTVQLSEPERNGMLDLLHAVVTSGTGTAANIGLPVYGKTGTTQDYRDAWFIGFVGDLVVGVWVGNDDNRPMRRVTGGSLPAQIWRDFMVQAVSDLHLKGEPPPNEGPVQLNPPSWDQGTPPAFGPNASQAPPPEAVPPQQPAYAPQSPYGQPQPYPYRPPPYGARGQPYPPRGYGPDEGAPQDYAPGRWRRRDFGPPAGDYRGRPYFGQDPEDASPDERHSPRYYGGEDDRRPSEPDDDE